MFDPTVFVQFKYLFTLFHYCFHHSLEWHPRISREIFDDFFDVSWRIALDIFLYSSIKEENITTVNGLHLLEEESCGCLIDDKLAFLEKNVTYVCTIMLFIVCFIFTRCPFLNLIEGFVSERNILSIFMICFICVTAKCLTDKCTFDF